MSKRLDQFVDVYSCTSGLRLNDKWDKHLRKFSDNPAKFRLIYCHKGHFLL